MDQINGISTFVLRVIKDSVLVVDSKGIVFVNKSFEELSEFSCNQLLDSPTSLFVEEEEFQAFFGLVKQHLSFAPIFNEAIVECVNQRLGPFLSKVAFHPTIDELDKTPRCVCLFTDPLFYKPLFENTTTLMGLIDYCEMEKEGVLLRANKAAATFFGIPPQEFVGNQLVVRKYLCRDLGFQLDAEDALFFQECWNADAPRVHRFCVVRGENKDLWLASTVTYVGRSLHGRPLFMLVAEDITDTVSLESEVTRSRNAAESQRTSFVKMVHELRSPLSGLLGVAGLLRNTMVTLEQLNLIKTMEACGDSLLLLIGNILDLSNLEHHNITLVSKPFEIVQCIEQALDVVSVLAMQKEIELLYELEDPHQPTIFIGDELRLRQIILNLLSNAVKFTENKGGSVLVRLHRPEHLGDGSERISLSVEDSGIGIPPDALIRIFNDFSQADSDISGRFGGSGLGLAIVQSLVSLMGGTISVEPKKNEKSGSVFRFSVVLQPSEQEETESKAKENFARKSALLLFRNVDLATNLSNRLVSLGMQVSFSLSEQPDVVFSDSPYVAVSSPLVVVDYLRPKGFVGGFLRKPIRSHDLLLVLHQSLHLPFTTASTSHNLKRARPTQEFYLRVLLVEDNVLNRKVTRNMLEAIGCASSSIYTASNGHDALKSLQNQMADIVLMDLEMPVMGGLEAVREIRKQWSEDPKRPFVVALTGSATKECEEECLAAGMNCFLTKPVQFNRLAELVKQASTELAKDVVSYQLVMSLSN